MKIKHVFVSLLALSALHAYGETSSRREIAWQSGGHVGTHWSMLDAVEQAISLAVTGDDLHSHQINLRRQNKQSFKQQADLTPGRPLCSKSEDADGWTNLNCRSFAIPKDVDPSTGCLSQRCTEIEFASFVVDDAAIWAAIEAAAKEPCKFIPDYRELQKRHRMAEPRGGATVHTSNASHYWLYCDTRRPVVGSLSATSKERVFVLRWYREAR